MGINSLFIIVLHSMGYVISFNRICYQKRLSLRPHRPNLQVVHTAIALNHGRYNRQDRVENVHRARGLYRRRRLGSNPVVYAARINRGGLQRRDWTPVNALVPETGPLLGSAFRMVYDRLGAKLAVSPDRQERVEGGPPVIGHTDKAARRLCPTSLLRNVGSSYSEEPGVEIL